LWSRSLGIWGKAGVVTEGKDSKTGDEGATMIFIGYTEQESDSVRMWDMHTTRVIVTCDVIWLKQMFIQNDESGILEL
jgi:hypothetical protein